MALSAAEEALVRELIAENPQLLSLADNEATIISKLGATKKNLSELAAALSLNDTDLAFVRQGSSDKSVALSVLKAFAVAGIPSATQTVSGTVELATDAETQTGTDATRAVTPAGLSSRLATETLTGLVELATAAEAQAFTANKFIDGAKLADAFKGSNVSLSATGYQKLPSGLIIQWFTAAITTSNQTFNFPIAFPNACLHVSGSAGAGYPTIVSFTNTGYTGQGPSSTTARIFAIGY